MFGVDAFDTDWLHWLDTRRAACRQASLLLLLDGAFVPGLCARVQAAVRVPDACSAVFAHLGGYTDEAREVSPFVVAFDPADQPVRALLRKCGGFPMVSCVETDERATRWAERLARWTVVDVGSSAFNFRHADARRLPAIARTLRPPQKRSLLGPATAWHCIDRTGRWQAMPHDGPGLGDPHALDDKPGVLDDAQFAHLVRDSEADEILSVLDARLGGAPAATNLARRHALAEAALARADAEGVEGTPDRLRRVEDALGQMGRSS